MLETQGGVSEQNKKSSNSSSNSQNENLVTANNRRNRQNVEQVQEQEMGLKQFSTITDLLIKLKGNLSKYLGYFIIYQYTEGPCLIRLLVLEKIRISQIGQK